jgi:hypothetical protein
MYSIQSLRLTTTSAASESVFLFLAELLRGGEVRREVGERRTNTTSISRRKHNTGRKTTNAIKPALWILKNLPCCLGCFCFLTGGVCGYCLGVLQPKFVSIKHAKGVGGEDQVEGMERERRRTKAWWSNLLLILQLFP